VTKEKDDLTGEKRMIVPKRLRKQFFEQFHMSRLGGGHMNIDKTIGKMTRYTWKDMRKDMSLWHKECYECQLRAPKRHKIPLVMTSLNRPFQRVGIDVCGPLHMTSRGNLHYVSMIDEFSKYVVVTPIPDTKAVTVAKAMWYDLVLLYGVPAEVITDNAKTFVAGIFQEVCTRLHIKKLNCTPHHSAGNAIAERPFRTFHDMVSKYLVSTDLEWDELIKEVASCYNMTPHNTTGESPFYLMFGRDPRLPIEDLVHVNKRKGDTVEVKEFRRHLVVALETAIANAKETMDKRMELAKRIADRNLRESDIMEGELVLYRDYRLRVGMSEKYKNQWGAVYRVQKIEGQHAYIVPKGEPDQDPKRVHLDQIKRFYSEEERLAKENEILKESTKPAKQPKKTRVSKQPENQGIGGKMDRKKGRYNLRTLEMDEKGVTHPPKKKE
jgi:hypothetical protein